jgi:hypothetical protein
MFSNKITKQNQPTLPNPTAKKKKKLCGVFILKSTHAQFTQQQTNINTNFIENFFYLKGNVKMSCVMKTADC